MVVVVAAVIVVVVLVVVVVVAAPPPPAAVAAVGVGVVVVCDRLQACVQERLLQETVYVNYCGLAASSVNVF